MHQCNGRTGKPRARPPQNTHTLSRNVMHNSSTGHSYPLTVANSQDSGFPYPSTGIVLLRCLHKIQVLFLFPLAQKPCSVMSHSSLMNLSPLFHPSPQDWQSWPAPQPRRRRRNRGLKPAKPIIAVPPPRGMLTTEQIKSTQQPSSIPPTPHTPPLPTPPSPPPQPAPSTTSGTLEDEWRPTITPPSSSTSTPLPPPPPLLYIGAPPALPVPPPPMDFDDLANPFIRKRSRE